MTASRSALARRTFLATARRTFLAALALAGWNVAPAIARVTPDYSVPVVVCDAANVAAAGDAGRGYVLLSMSRKLDGARMDVSPSLMLRGKQPANEVCRGRAVFSPSFRNENTPGGEVHEHKQDFILDGVEFSLYLFEVPAGEYEFAQLLATQPTASIGTAAYSGPALVSPPEFKMSAQVRKGELAYLGEVLLEGRAVERSVFGITTTKVTVGYGFQVKDAQERDLTHFAKKYPQVAARSHVNQVTTLRGQSFELKPGTIR
jgi:hypothetical protein